MKNKFVLVIILIFGHFFCFGQTLVEDMAIQICKKLDKINLEESTNTINQIGLEIIHNTYQENADEILQLMTKQSGEFESKSDIELSKIVGSQVTYILMKDCKTFQRITMFNNEPIPEVSIVTEMIGIDFTKILDKKLKTAIISDPLIDECMGLAMDQFEQELVEQFGSKYSIEFSKEFFVFLITRCEPYMKWTLQNR